eukprot:scpid83711/ scgid25467/ 
MFGKRIAMRKPPMKTADIWNLSAKRYDPTKPECAALEIARPQAVKKAANISLDRFDNDEDSDGLPSRHAIAAAKADISQAPEVSSERYFKSSGKLKDLFSKTAATGSFSFSFPGGDDAAAATGVKGDDTRKNSDDTRHTGSTFNKGSDGNPVSTATGTQQQQQRRRKPMWRPDAVRDTSDEESDEDVGVDDNSMSADIGPVEDEKFLFTLMNSEAVLDLSHVKAALSRFRRNNTVEEIEEQWRENRHFLTKSYKQKHKDAMRQQRRQQHRSSDQAGGGGAGTRKRKHRA